LTTLPRRIASTTAAPLELTIQAEAFGKISAELPPLFARVDVAKFPVDPDWAQLLRMAISGNLTAITARYNSLLVGVAISVIGPALMNKALLQAVTTLIWVDPAYRRGWFGMKFIKANRDTLVELGAKRLCISHAPKDRRLAAVYRRAGYRLDEISYVKVVK
jgi:GNAT superfamily N-acetyltransferase